MKHQIRDQLKKRKSTQPVEQSAGFFENSLESLIQPGQTIAGFSPTQHEPKILNFLAKRLKYSYFPKWENGAYFFGTISDLKQLQPGALGILEPINPQKRLSQSEAKTAIDVWLVPGLAFDKRGGRLGRGKGYYDRFLANVKGLKIGLCFSDQLIDSVPTEDHDVVMDRILTENELINCSS